MNSATPKFLKPLLQSFSFNPAIRQTIYTTSNNKSLFLIKRTFLVTALHLVYYHFLLFLCLQDFINLPNQYYDLIEKT